jgi:hypothetical protein
VCCTKVLGSSPNFLPLLNRSDVCLLSYELFPKVVEQSLSGAHGSLQVEVPFPTVVELEVENLPPPRVDYGVAIFSWIQYFFPTTTIASWDSHAFPKMQF